MNPSPKSHVESKFVELFGDTIDFEVVCRDEPIVGRHGYKAQLIVDNLVVAEAFDRSSRPRSFAKLAIVVEKLYTAGLALV